jgi:trans-aconitate methyltransferase
VVTGVTGVDPAAAILAVARRKPHAEQVKWIESSAQSYKAHRRFDLIVMTGHAFQILHTDADALAVFDTMRGHLKERRRVAFETRNPRVNWVGEDRAAAIDPHVARRTTARDLGHRWRGR